ncbi:MAG: DUF4920 domain-containing protein [Reichenbachiella sp.]|uniref:DUF4920 domain-containing protein n=1 Tax=Reichenbachiella sp. TaxID=2184521 RepID=UPI003266A922
MNKIILLSVTVLILMGCTKKDPAGEQKSLKTYGEAFDSAGSSDISNLSSLMGNLDSVALTLTAQIEKTCAVKGCWMQLKTDNGNPLRVTFKDYGFFIPKSGVEGKVATIKGYCIKQETSVEELQHYAQDAGESPEYIASITSPKMEFNFVASGVIIED